TSLSSPVCAPSRARAGTSSERPSAPAWRCVRPGGCVRHAIEGGSMKRSLLLLPGPVTVSQPVLEAMGRRLFNHRDAPFGELLDRVVRAMQPAFGTAGGILVLGSS